MTPPINIDGTQITGASIDGTDVQAITVDGTQVFTRIPDSAIHRWKLDDVGTGTVTDSIGSANGSVSGVSNINGTFQGGSAGDGDGTDDIINTSPLSDFGSTVMGTSHAIAFTIDNFVETDTGPFTAAGIGNSGSSGNLFHLARVSQFNAGDLRIFFADANRDFLFASTDSGSHVNDGNKHRVVINIGDPGGSNNISFFNNTSELASSLGGDQGYDTFEDFDSDYALFASNNGGSGRGFIDATIDDFILYSDTLSSSEIDDDFNAQPWA